MKITPIPPQSSVSKLFRTRRVADSYAPRTQGNDEVQISESAQSFAAVYRAVHNEISNASPEYRARVEDIARQVQDGSYSVKSEDVAEKMIEDLFI